MKSRHLFLLLLALCSLNVAHAENLISLVSDDVKHVITVPTHWDDAAWHEAGWVSLGILGTAIIVDKPLQNEMRRHAPNNNGALLQIERFGSQYAVGVVGGFYLAGLAGNERATAVAQDGLAASLIASGLIAPTIKLVVGRSRPNANNGNAHFQPFTDLNSSFPSGHTTEAFALATVIADHYDERWVQYSAYSMAGLVGLARSYHDAHFASDIVAGAVLGTWVGQSVVAHNQTLRAGKVALLPDINSGNIGMRLAGNF